MSRLVSLDFLRFVAVLLVIGRHAFPIYPWIYGPLAYIGDVFKSVGYLGVDLFFVLSGFLVSGLLFKEIKENQKIRIFRFYVRRGFKIYPSFYVFLIASIFLPRPDSNFLGEALFLQNYVGAVWFHTWSLAVEEHFYLLLPLVISLVRPSVIPVLFPVVAVLTLILRVTTGEGLMFETHLRLDALFFGTYLSYLQHFRSLESFRGRTLVLLAVAMLLAAPLVPIAFTYTLAYLGFGIVIVNMLDAKASVMKPFAYLGKHSYSIYLWHEPVRFFLINAFPTDPEHRLGINVAYVVLSFAVGIIFAKAIEFPFLRLRDTIDKPTSESERTLAKGSSADPRRSMSTSAPA